MADRVKITAVVKDYQHVAPGAGTLDIVPGATSLDGNYVEWPTSGNILLLFYNTDVGATTVTITGKADKWGRTGAITAYSLAASDLAIAGPFSADVWKNTCTVGGVSTDALLLDASDVDLHVAAIQVP